MLLIIFLDFSRIFPYFFSNFSRIFSFLYSLIDIGNYKPSAASGFEDAYKAHCIQMKTKINYDYIYFIRNLSDQYNVELDLTQFPAAFESKSGNYKKKYPKFRLIVYA